MRIATRITLFATPLLMLPAVGQLYTHLNIGRRMFVERLGCGCGPFLNTNHLSLTISGLLLVSAAGSWWFAARGLSRTCFWSMVAGYLVLGLVFFRQFMYHNLWL